PGCGLEAHDRIGRGHRTMRLHEGLHAAQLPLIALRLELSQQRRCRDLIGFGRLHALHDVRVKRLELRGPGLTRLVAWYVWRGQVTGYGIAGNAQASRDLARRYALGLEYMDGHPLILLKHRRPSRTKA